MILKEADTLDLHLSDYKPHGYVPRPSAAVRVQVANEGIGQPLSVRQSPDGYEILTNPAVWIAAGMSQLPTVPVWIVDCSDEQAQRMVSLNYVAGEKLNCIDEAEIYQSLIGVSRRGSISRLARELGLKRSVVSHALRLLNLEPSVKEKIRSGELSAGHGRALLRVDGKKQVQLARAVIQDNMSVRALEKVVGGPGVKTTSGEMTPSKRSADEVRFESELTDWIGSKTVLDDGRLVIDYNNDIDVLSGILEKIGFEFG